MLKSLLNIEKSCFCTQMFSTTLLSHMYFTTRNCESDHSISLKFIEGHSTSRTHVLSAINFSANIRLFRVHLSKGCLYFKGEGDKLGDLSEAMSCI